MCGQWSHASQPHVGVQIADARQEFDAHALGVLDQARRHLPVQQGSDVPRLPGDDLQQTVPFGLGQLSQQYVGAVGCTVPVAHDRSDPSGTYRYGSDGALTGEPASVPQLFGVERRVLQRLQPPGSPPRLREAASACGRQSIEGALSAWDFGLSGRPLCRCAVCGCAVRRRVVCVCHGRLLRSSTRLCEFAVGQLGQRGLAGAQDRLRELLLALQHLGDAVLDGPLGDQPVDLHGLCLPDAVRPVGGLRLDRGIPPAVVVDDMRRPASDSGPCPLP